MASRDRRHSLLARHALSCLAAPALSQRDLAWFCIARGKLSLFGGPRLLALGINRPSACSLQEPIGYQHSKEKHLHRYLAEFDFRYNTRTALGYNDFMRAPNSRPRASSASASPIDGLTSKVRPKPSEALSGMAREAAPETRARALLAIAQAA